MKTTDFSPPDYAVLDGADALEDPPTTEVVRWYERPGWPLGKVAPNAALAAAFGLGVAAGIGMVVGTLWVRDHLWDDED